MCRRNPYWQDVEPPAQRAKWVTKIGQRGTWDTVLDATEVRVLEMNLIKEMRTGLSTADEPSRFMYIMESKKHLPGLFKVGVARRPKSRLTQIKKACGLDDLKIIHSFPVKNNPLRVEKLIHLTLNLFGDAMPCKHGPHGTITELHREWFWCDLGVAKKVVEFWVQWMAKQPYKKPELTDYWLSRVERIRGIIGFHNYETFDDILTRFKAAMEPGVASGNQADWEAAQRQAQAKLAATASGSDPDDSQLTHLPPRQHSSADAFQFAVFPPILSGIASQFAKMQPPPALHVSTGGWQFAQPQSLPIRSAGASSFPKMRPPSPPPSHSSSGSLQPTELPLSAFGFTQLHPSDLEFAHLSPIDLDMA